MKQEAKDCYQQYVAKEGKAKSWGNFIMVCLQGGIGLRAAEVSSLLSRVGQCERQEGKQQQLRMV